MAEVTLSPKQAMQLAIRLAKKGLGFVAPNPPVGCVILDRNYRLLSSGYHKTYGGDHAEISALKKIVDTKKLKGAHLFVTLEPCHHYGKTPSCAAELVKYSWGSLTYGGSDPLTLGKGIRFLKKKGIRVLRTTDCKFELEQLIEFFKFSNRYQRPFVSLKVASSLDGVIATPNSQQVKSLWITQKKAREYVHFLRGIHDAVLVGAHTLIQDNPRLNSRNKQFLLKQNKVIILDPKGEVFPFLSRSRLIKTHSASRIIIFCLDQKKVKSSYKKLKLQVHWIKNHLVKKYHYSKLEKKDATPVFPLDFLLKILYQKENIQSLMVEGGAFCFSQFLQQKMAQKLYLHMAPILLGEGLCWSKYLKIKNLKASPLIKNVQYQMAKPDLLLEGYLKFTSA